MKIKYFAWIKDITDKEFDIILKDHPKNIDDLKKIFGKILSRFTKSYI